MSDEQHDEKQQGAGAEQDLPDGQTASVEIASAEAEHAVETANEAAMAQLDVDAPAPKDPENTLDPVISGERIPVSVAEIDRELVQIWKATTSRRSDDEKGAVSLLRAMNLLVYVDSEERAATVDEVIGQVTGRHPCRTILIVRQEDLADRANQVTAWISAHCQLPETADRYICSEQITIAAEGRAVERVPNMALNLLVTDLPVFLWWHTGAAFQGYVRDHLVASVDRVIFDSSLWEDPIGSLLDLASSSPHQEGTRYAPTDFNWGRLGIWRESSAQFFDAPAQRQFLSRLALVQVEYADAGAGDKSNPIQALLYVGWLATRLGWNLVRGQEGSYTRGHDVVFSYRQGQRPIQVVLRPQEPTKEIEQGMMVVRLATGGPDRATYEIRMGTDTCTTTIVDTKTGEPVRRTRGFLPTSDASLLDQELEIFGHDAIYEDALQAAAQMIVANPALRDRAAYDAEQERRDRRAFDPRF